MISKKKPISKTITTNLTAKHAKHFKKTFQKQNEMRKGNILVKLKLLEINKEIKSK